MEHILKGVDPRIELRHFQDVIAERRKSHDLVGEPIPPALLLDPADRPRYLLCFAAVKQFEVLKGKRGISDIHDMVEHLELVREFSLGQDKIPASELRTYSLDLLRSMKGQMAKQA
ncbi:hypothetical protein ACRCPS_18340 [Pseudomonas aeruginosa]